MTKEAATRIKCKFCGSKNTIRNGGLKRWSGGRKYRIQYHLCHDCGRTTTGDKTRIGGLK